MRLTTHSNVNRSVRRFSFAHPAAGSPQINKGKSEIERSLTIRLTRLNEQVAAKTSFSGFRQRASFGFRICVLLLCFREDEPFRIQKSLYTLLENPGISSRTGGTAPECAPFTTSYSRCSLFWPRHIIFGACTGVATGSRALLNALAGMIPNSNRRSLIGTSCGCMQ